MQRRGKIIESIDPANVYINTSNLSDSDYETVEKDRFLVEAALSADKIIITRDESFKEALAKTPEGPSLIEKIIRINPIIDGIELLYRL